MPHLALLSPKADIDSDVSEDVRVLPQKRDLDYQFGGKKNPSKSSDNSFLLGTSSTNAINS